MKIVSTSIKLLVALAAVAGAVYVAATYGDKIVAWCKKMINCKCCCAAEAEIVEEAAVEEAPAEEAAVEEAPAEEAPAVAESDFEG